MKRFKAVTAALCLAATLISSVKSQATATPYFIALNNTLRPLNSTTIPQVFDGEIFVPHDLFGLLHTTDLEAGRARLALGGRRLDFYVTQGITVNRNGDFLSWPHPRRVGNIFYVPLRHVTDYFGLTYEIIDVGHSIIPDQPMQVIRIITDPMFAHDAQRFLSNNRDVLRAAYSAYFGRPPGEAPLPTADPEPPPTYSDVTIYLSFHNLDTGNLGIILDSLSHPDAKGYRAAFFVSAGEIASHAGIIRRISGSGHAIGIWLEEGTPEEYLDTSAFLFEAAKIRTLLISAYASSADLDAAEAVPAAMAETTTETMIETAAETAMETARSLGLVFLGVTQVFEPLMNDTGGISGNSSGSAYAEIFPTESGSRHTIGFDCTDETASLLPGVLAFLSAHEYAAGRVSETVDMAVNAKGGTG